VIRSHEVGETDMFAKLGSHKELLTAVVLFATVILIYVGSNLLWLTGVLAGQWAADYHKSLVGISLLELGDGTQILGAGLALFWLQMQGVRGVIKVDVGIFIASLLVPTVGILIAVGLERMGVPELYMRIGSVIVLFLLGLMAYKSTKGGDDNWWTRKVISWKDWLGQYGATAQTAVLFFLLEIPDKTGIGTGGLQLVGLLPTANAIGATNALIAVNFATSGFVLLLGHFLEKWVGWVGYLGAATFWGGSVYMLTTLRPLLN
jgi:putative Ca2+/H+ antiporter (TMEM165/GDT1 family)